MELQKQLFANRRAEKDRAAQNDISGTIEQLVNNWGQTTKVNNWGQTTNNSAVGLEARLLQLLDDPGRR